ERKRRRIEESNTQQGPTNQQQPHPDGEPPSAGANAHLVAETPLLQHSEVTAAYKPLPKRFVERLKIYIDKNKGTSFADEITDSVAALDRIIIGGDEDLSYAVIAIGDLRDKAKSLSENMWDMVN